MSTLQISLAVVGVVLLGLIVAYNAWNNRRHAPKRADRDEQARQGAEDAARFEPALDGVDVTDLPPHMRPAATQPLSTPLHDPLLDAMPERPEFDAPLAAPLPEKAAAPVAADSAAVDAPAAPAAPAHQPLPAERKLALDGLIDAIAPIQMEQSVSGEAALQVQPTTRRAGSKPFRIEGFNEATRDWESVRAGQRYNAFQAGVQLANRTGALNEIEFSEFAAKAQTFADALNGALELPDMLHEVGRARELDQFASEHDAQLSFMLRARTAAWSPGYVRQHAGQQGFVMTNMPGRMMLPSPVPGNYPLLVLAFDAQAAQAADLDRTAFHDVMLSLDVPQVPRTEQPFARLREVAQALCEAMDGVLCDQNGQPLHPQVLEPIAGDLEQLYDQLDQRELSAGSMLARRLFN
ncbi:MAG: cell division protein ZipA C-terminal FtsZ-binding domain-containing protein [Comamonas sp.]